MWERVTIADREADLFVPSAPSGQGALIYLHGYQGETLRENEVFTRLFEQYQLPVVSPVGGGCWWLDRICPDLSNDRTPIQYVNEDVVAWIEAHWQVSPPLVALLGVSMGGQGVLNLAYRKALRFPVVAAISPAIDFDRIHGRGFGVESIFASEEEARQETAVLHLHPLNWPKHQFFCSDPQDFTWHAGSERLASKLASSGVPFERELQTSYGGHGWTYFNAMAEQAVQFVSQSLKKEASAL